MIKLNKDQPKVLSDNLFPVIGIGASAGGLDAFKRFLKAMPEKSGMAYIIVQHLDPSHESLLPELLSQVTKIPVHEITNNVIVKPDNIYIIPFDKLLTATDGVLQLSPRPLKKTFLSIDLFFNSLAEIHRGHSVGIVLSGTGTDGTLGLKAIKEHGGTTFAQDSDSSGYNNMPRSAIDSGVVDYILSPEQIAEKLMEIISPVGKLKAKDTQNKTAGSITKGKEDRFYQEILSLVDRRKNVDFTYYKQTTIRRRINHRMAFNNMGSIEEYLIYASQNMPEQDALYEDLLIHATGFFRDSHTYTSLCELIFPSILKAKPGTEPIRIWVAGCSTGEEAYSISICLRQYLDTHLPEKETGPDVSPKEREKTLNRKIRIFATDISETAVVKARRGRYSLTELQGVSEIQLEQFFVKEDTGNYTVNKSIREMCVFATHNFLKDPPFPHMDLISCRNVLIYMDRFLQKKALATFHYSLNQKGFLLLGNSETAGVAPLLFAPISKTEKLYLKKPAASRYTPVPMVPQKLHPEQQQEIRGNDRTKDDYEKISDNILLSTFIPAGVVVNDELDILHFRGATGDYLQPSPGKASLNLLKMAREGLSFELRSIIQKVKSSKNPVSKKNILLNANNIERFVNIIAIPLPNTIEPFYLIVFQEASSPVDFQVENEQTDLTAKVTFTKKDTQHHRIQQLEQELSQARLDMRSITEAQEAANEELQTVNEELLSGSEELQSLNQELITSKEELQSSNEQLTFLNHELLTTIEELDHTRKYSEAIVNTVREPLIILDMHLKVKTANPSFYKIFNTNHEETEGKMFQDICNGQWNGPALLEKLHQVGHNGTFLVDFEIHTVFPHLGGQRIMVVKARLIVTDKDLEPLMLVSIEDVTDFRTSENAIRESEKRLNEIFNHTFVGLAFSDLTGRFIQMNNAFCNISGYSEEELLQLDLQSIIHPDDYREKSQQFIDLIQGTVAGFVIEQQFIKKDGGTVWVRNSVSVVKGEMGSPKSIVTICQDINKEKQAQQSAEESNDRFMFLANTMPMQMWTASVEGKMTYFNEAVYQYSGLTFDDLKDYNWQRQVHAEDREKNLRDWEDGIINGKDIALEHRFIRHDGSYRWHLSRALALKDPDGKVLMWVGTSTDIHDQKQMEVELEKRVQERTQDLQEANLSLESSNKNLEQFAYIASHDLQEPLRKIRTYSTWLNSHFEMSEKPREYLDKIANSVERMAALIDDLLNFYLLLRPGIAMEQIDLNIVLNSVINDFNLDITHENAVLDVGHLPTLAAIPLQISQLFHNLLSNALKFTKEGVPPVIRITAKMLTSAQIKNYSLHENVSYCEIIFEDNGIGFDQEFGERIFVIFQRLNSRHKYSGTGIGLALCQKIVMNHNGLIYANGEENKGASFHIVLPMQGTM